MSSLGPYRHRDNPTAFHLRAKGLHPSRKRVPSAGSCNRSANLLHEDEERARPKRRAMNFTRRPQVVGYQQEQENI